MTELQDLGHQRIAKLLVSGVAPKERCMGESPKLVDAYGNAYGGDRSLDFRVS